MGRQKTVKIDVRRYVNLLDYEHIAEMCANVIECAGGRLLMGGYVCPHCGVDTSVGPYKCGAPLSEYDTTVVK